MNVSMAYWIARTHSSASCLFDAAKIMYFLSLYTLNWLCLACLSASGLYGSCRTLRCSFTTKYFLVSIPFSKASFASDTALKVSRQKYSFHRLMARNPCARRMINPVLIS